MKDTQGAAQTGPNDETPEGMKRYDIEGTIVVQATIEARTAREAVTLFMLQNPDADPETIGSRAIVGLDEGDGTPILEGDDYTQDEDGVKLLTGRVDGLGEDDVVFTDDEDEDTEEPG